MSLNKEIEYFNQRMKSTTNYKSFKPCYDCFVKYISNNIEGGTISEKIEKISLFDIRESCKLYVENSKKCSSYEAIHRYLNSIRILYYEYLKESNIVCKSIESGINTNENADIIANMVNKEMRNKVYWPLSNIEIANQCYEELNENKLIPLETKAIYKLFITYGFKENVITEMTPDAFDKENKKLIISGVDYTISLNLADEIYELLVKINNFINDDTRNYMFVNTKKGKLQPCGLFRAIKEKAIKRGLEEFTPTSAGLYGVKQLIKKGLDITEICALTSFDADKVKEINDYMTNENNISININNKLSN